MTVPTKYVLQQGPVIGTLAGVALGALRQRIHGMPTSPPPLPTPEIVVKVPVRSKGLLKAYIRHVGGDPSAYKGVLPAHFFPQWGFPLAARLLLGLPYPLGKTLNGGCRIQMNAPLPADEPLIARGRLLDIDDNGRRAVFHQQVITGTAAVPDALIADLYGIVPVPPPPGPKPPGPIMPPKASKPKPRIPAQAEELARFRLRADAGLDFAKLTGDFNPVHWISPYARAFGFRNTILHGFSTMARAIEGLHRSLFSGSVNALHTFDCRFTRPLVLPAKVGLYLQGQEVFVGDAPGGPAYLVGKYTPRSEANS